MILTTSGGTTPTIRAISSNRGGTGLLKRPASMSGRPRPRRLLGSKPSLPSNLRRSKTFGPRAPSLSGPHGPPPRLPSRLRRSRSPLPKPSAAGWRSTPTARLTSNRACAPRAVSRGAGTSAESTSRSFGAARPANARGELIRSCTVEAGRVAFGCAGAFRIGQQSGVHVACIGPPSALYRPSNGL